MEMTATAEGGLDEVTDILQRMRELAVASASETLSDTERLYLQDEYSELLSEIDRIVNSTEFAGKRLLAPKGIDVVFMIDTSDSMRLEIPGFQAEIAGFRETLQDAGLDVRMGLAGVSASQDTIDGNTTAIDLTGDEDAFDAALAAFSNNGVGLMDPYTSMLDQAGVVKVAGDNGPENHVFRSDAQKLIIYAADTGLERSLTSATEASAAAALADAGFEVHVLTLVAAYGSEYDEITTATGGSLQVMNGFGVNYDVILDNIAQQVISQARPVEPLEVQAGTTSGVESRIELGFPVDNTAVALGIDETDIETVATARSAIDLLDDALVQVGSSYAVLGASYNRLESAAAHHEDRLAALASAESTIRDADMALITSDLTAAQIMQQSGIAARAQAAGLHKSAIPALIN